MKRRRGGSRHLEELESALVHLRRVWQHPRLRKLFLEHFGRDLEIGTYRTLRAIEGLDDPDIGLGDVAAAMNVDRSTASRLVDRVVEAGMVARSASPEDRRRVRLRLTRAGEDYLSRARTARIAVLRRLTRDWSGEDAARLAELLTRFSDSIESL